MPDGFADPGRGCTKVSCDIEARAQAILMETIAAIGAAEPCPPNTLNTIECALGPRGGKIVKRVVVCKFGEDEVGRRLNYRMTDRKIG